MAAGSQTLFNVLCTHMILQNDVVKLGINPALILHYGCIEDYLTVAASIGVNRVVVGVAVVGTLMT